MIDKKTIAADERLRQEFNQWAEQGRREEMENHHISITQQRPVAPSFARVLARRVGVTHKDQFLS